MKLEKRQRQEEPGGKGAAGKIQAQRCSDKEQKEQGILAFTEHVEQRRKGKQVKCNWDAGHPPQLLRERFEQARDGDDNCQVNQSPGEESHSIRQQRQWPIKTKLGSD